VTDEIAHPGIGMNDLKLLELAMDDMSGDDRVAGSAMRGFLANTGRIEVQPIP
jgi:hypothetical protein